jgi:hypothetical protein
VGKGRASQYNSRLKVCLDQIGKQEAERRWVRRRKGGRTYSTIATASTPADFATSVHSSRSSTAGKRAGKQGGKGWASQYSRDCDAGLE